MKKRNTPSPFPPFPIPETEGLARGIEGRSVGSRGEEVPTNAVLRNGLPQDLQNLGSEDVEIHFPVQELIDDFNQHPSE